MLRPLSYLAIASCAGCAMAGGSNVDARLRITDGDNTNVDSPVGRDGTPSSCAMPFTGVLATWSFTGQSGTEASVDSTSTAPGGTAGPVTRSSGLVGTAGTNSINSNTWSTATTLDQTTYYTFSITPPDGCTLSLTQAAIDALASGTGPASGAIATSDDSFTQTAAVSTGAPSTPALSVTGASGMVEIRVFGYAATKPVGTLRVENALTVSGSFD